MNSNAINSQGLKIIAKWTGFAFVVLSVIFGLGFGPSPSQKTSAAKLAEISKADTFCDADSCPGEVLFKLNRCPADLDLKKLASQIGVLGVDSITPDSTMIITPVTRDCIFLVKSSTKTVKEIMQIFALIQQKTFKISLLNRSDQEEIALEDYEPNFKMHVDLEPVSKSKTSVQSEDFWWFGKAFPGTDAATVWGKYGKGSDQVLVAVLDTGISREHPDLAANLWTTTEPFDIDLGGKPIHCKPGSWGFDATTSDLNKMCYPIDDSGHGTHVAGIIGGKAVGVNKKVSLMSLKVADANGYTCVSNVLKAIDFATQVRQALKLNLRVLNNSYYVAVSCPERLTLLEDRIKAANSHNMLFVAAAGQTDIHYPARANNDDYPTYPSNFAYLPNVISVTAIDQKGGLSERFKERANHGKRSVLLAAPGSSIYSTYLPSVSAYGTKTGTSMATPFVTGAAALMLSVPGCSDLSPVQVKERILTGTIRTKPLKGKTATNGRLNIYNSIKSCASNAKLPRGH